MGYPAAPEKINSRVAKALSAMASLGIDAVIAKPVLKRLLKLYNNNWELIEEDNFRTLADAIFDKEDDKAKTNNVLLNKDVESPFKEPPLKKSKRGLVENEVSPAGSSRKHIIDDDDRKLTKPSSRLRKVELSQSSSGDTTRNQIHHFNEAQSRSRRQDPTSSNGSTKENIADLEDRKLGKTSSRLKKAESSQSVPRESTSKQYHSGVNEAPTRNRHKDSVRVKPAPSGDKLFTRPASGELSANHEPDYEMIKTTSDQENKKQAIDQLPIHISHAHQGSTNASQSNTSKKKDISSSGSNNQTTYDIASSPCGQAKVSLTCSHAIQQHNSSIPDVDYILRFAESHSQKYYRAFGERCSFVKLLNKFCEGLLEMASSSLNRSYRNRSNTNSTDSPLRLQLGIENEDLGKRVSSCSGSSDPQSMVIAGQQAVAHNVKKRVLHEVSDITKGTEKVKISLHDELGTEDLPHFVYIPENVTYESAYVHSSLARVSDEDCCSSCTGDCLSSSIPCACARDTGGEYAYTLDGLLTEKFLKACISMKDASESQNLFYCQDCPLERAKNGIVPEKCKGHLLRKFIKECWRKCGCNMSCGNRVVQRGIATKLQVFLTGEGKGWGIRTLEELPKGAFVCEYVGEILTNIELYERNKISSGNGKHVYPVLLDADWATEGVLEDDDALCLDATHYGNVARFINHRCFEGNLIEIPVQVETPDRHYYHLAFFTKRKVHPLEELTWDYGIDFDDENHPIEAFECRCGSQYCRDRRRK